MDAILRRLAAVTIHEISKHERQPGNDFVLVAFAKAKQIVLASSSTDGPMAPRSPWDFVPTLLPVASFSAQQVTRAEAMLDLITELGDRGGRYQKSDATNRLIIDLLANQLNSSAGTTNYSKIGKRKEIGLTHTSVMDRKEAWCRRVAAALRTEFPDIFGASETIANIRKNGANLVATAAELMARNIPAPRGGRVWTATQVSRVLDQAA